MREKRTSRISYLSQEKEKRDLSYLKVRNLLTEVLIFKKRFTPNNKLVQRT